MHLLWGWGWFRAGRPYAVRARFRRFWSSRSAGIGDLAVWCLGGQVDLRCVVCLLGIIVGLSLGANASVPVGLGLISAPGSLLTPVSRLSDLFTDLGVFRIVSFPARLFFGEGFVLPGVGVAHGLVGMAELVQARSGASVATLRWRLLPDRRR